MTVGTTYHPFFVLIITAVEHDLYTTEMISQVNSDEIASKQKQ